jgi:pilus assembly protein Flp/PilA
LVRRVLVVRVIARHLWRDRRGAALIEYTLLIGLITLTALGAVIAAGSWANGMWLNFLSSLGP